MRTRVFLIALVVSLIGPTQLNAFCFAPKMRVDDEFFVSAFVFTGTIVQDEKKGLGPEGFYDADVFTWRIQRVFRGPVKPGEFLRTVSGNDSGRFPLDAVKGHEVGRTFLIFVSQVRPEDGKYAIDSCGNSVELSKASSVVRTIEQLPTRQGGLIYGEMIDGETGVRVVALGKGKAFQSASNSNGEFALSVPPGTYTVTANKVGHDYVSYGLAYKNAKQVTVPRGGSAGIAFRETGR